MYTYVYFNRTLTHTDIYIYWESERERAGYVVILHLKYICAYIPVFGIGSMPVS